MSNANNDMRLGLEHVSDLYIRDNFLAVQGKWNDQVFNKGDFQWYEFDITEAVGSLKLYHTLGFVPQDAIITRAVGSSYTFDYDYWTDEYVVINTTGPLYIRLYLGSMNGLSVGGQEVLSSTGGTVLGEGFGGAGSYGVGSNGTNGTNGIDGIDGVDGTNGIDGATGLDGMQFPWDDITKTSPSPTVDLYTYTLLTVNVRTITITYASFLKAEILSIVKVEF